MEKNHFSPRLLQRFCKEQNIPINVFQQPYFDDRIDLFDKIYKTRTKYETFVDSMKQYKNEQEYFDDYSRIKDEAILSIKSTDGYKLFNELDMKNFPVHKDFSNLPSTTIYNESYVGKRFMIIDMIHANYSVLDNFNHGIFNYSHSWEEFIGGFTSNKHIISSKYIRQVILGNCNPGRHISYQKYIMSYVLHKLYEYLHELNAYVPNNDTFAFYNDEIVYDVTNIPFDKLFKMKMLIDSYETFYPIRCEIFTLYNLDGYGYAKRFYDCTIQIKCGETEFLPMIIRKMNGEEIMQKDLVFTFKGQLAVFCEIPEKIKNGDFVRCLEV